MAAVNHQLFVYDNGRKIKDSNDLEMIVRALSVSADGNNNGLTITEATGKFDFNAKVLGNIAAGTAAGQALSYSQRGAASGVASLDSGGKVPASELPNSIMEYVGTFNPSTHVPNLQNGGAAIASSKIIQDITYAAKAAGVAGDAITITYVSDVTAGSETAAAVGNVFTVHIETGVSTATQVKAAVDAANVLVDATISGTAGNAQTTQGPTNLAGGADAVNAGSVYKATAAGSHNFGAGAIAFVTGDYAIYNASGVWELAHSGADSVISVNGASGAVSLDTDDISDTAATNKYYTATAARGDLIAASISDGDTTHAPDGNSVFDALAGKSDTGHNHSGVYSPVGHDHSGVYDPAGTAAAIVAASIVDNDTTHAPSGEAVYEALALKANTADLGSAQYASFTNKELSAITVRQFVKMTVAGQVTLLAAADAANNDESFFGCVKDASIAADAAGAVYLPEVGARVTGFSTLDVTKLLYASTGGGYTQTRPTTGKVIILGRAVSATEIVFIGRFEAEYV
jgi:hypothetical protein